MKQFVAALLVAFACGLAFGQAAEVEKPDPVTEQRLKDLAEELRCLVCQNQTIADSNATLALDLRNQIREQIRAGRTNDQIRDYMVARYGDFVLYRPPLKPTTAPLWLGPLVLLALGGFVFWGVVAKRRANTKTPGQSPGRREEIEALLDERAGPKP